MGTPEKWRGVYSHFDSYPEGLGKSLWDHVKQEMATGKTLAEIAGAILLFDDWANYLKGGVCEYCGKMTGQPHSISGAILGMHEEFKTKAEMRSYYSALPAWKGREDEIEQIISQDWVVRNNIQRTGYPDPEAIHHQHNQGSTADNQITHEFSDPLFIEWVYILDPDSNSIHVLTHQGKRVKPLAGEYRSYRMRSGRTRYSSGCIYWHEYVTSLYLDAPEPEWDNLRKPAAA